MFITKCDICKKEIKKEQDKITVGTKGHWAGFEFCSNCGKPVEKFLLQKKLIEKASK